MRPVFLFCRLFFVGLMFASSAYAESGDDDSGVLKTITGRASYYADWFHGRTAASGEKFDNGSLVAAHPSFPFGTVLKVTNLSNERSVNVRVNDRGPSPERYAHGIVIDLSRIAAEQLGFIRKGLAKVRIEVLEWGSNARN